jgi:hypothetical protein
MGAKVGVLVGLGFAVGVPPGVNVGARLGCGESVALGKPVGVTPVDGVAVSRAGTGVVIADGDMVIAWACSGGGPELQPASRDSDMKQLSNM